MAVETLAAASGGDPGGGGEEGGRHWRLEVETLAVEGEAGRKTLAARSTVRRGGLAPRRQACGGGGRSRKAAEEMRQLKFCGRKMSGLGSVN
ncbi:unnamed protein product [Cuscuta campestris]|uniref:Uncharacterized protein n=1 Tax=Cuscuta campestris TaxID=132261 RepID=A0A484LV71_9ASTE|nr:unnamed protein product [Cuscuta campestris]